MLLVSMSILSFCREALDIPLRCVIAVVLSNNKNKLLVHMFIVINTSTFLIVRLLLLRYNYIFRPTLMAETCSCTLVILNVL